MKWTLWGLGARLRYTQVLCATIILLLGTLATGAWADNHDLGILAPRLEIKPDGTWSFTTNARLTGKELGTMIEESIGKDNYQSTTVILNTCHSAAGIGTVQGALKGSNKVIATCGEGQSTNVSIDKDKNLTGFLPSFWESVNADPNKPVDSYIEEGMKKEPRLPKTPEEEAAMKNKYERYRAALIEKNKVRAAKGQTPYIVPPAWDAGGRDQRIQQPQSAETVDKPGAKKIASGTKSNHAIIFRTDGRDASKLEGDKAKEALNKAGYDSVAELTPMSKSDFDEISSASANNRVPKIRDDAATPENLKKAIESLKTKLNKDETLTVVAIGHGEVVRQSDKTAGASGIGNGAHFALGTGTDHISNQAVGSLLAEEVRDTDGAFLFDDYNYTRWNAPALAIQTAAERSVSGAGVGVYINDVFLGDIFLGLNNPGDPAGFHYLPFSDEVIKEVINATDFTAGLDIRFDFGGPSDFFTLATPEDLNGIANGWGYGFAGMNLVFGLDGDDGVVPEPQTLMLLAIGLAVLAARRWRVVKAAGNGVTH